MLYPAISELESITKSRYALVIVTAKRARQLLEASMANEIKLEDKPVKLAIDDIASGRVKCKEYKLEGLDDPSDEVVETEE
jgi:DNA-directed RNA polymerase subunit omega